MTVHTEKIGDKTINIVHDESPMNPREDWDNLSTFAFFHRNYKNESDIRTSDFDSLEEIQEYIEKELNAIWMPVYLYSHSGDTIATTPFSCPWDSGQLGFAYVEREKIRNEWGWKRISPKRKEQIENLIKGEIETFNQWINGEVYGYEIVSNDGQILDGCYGYFGLDYCIEDAKNNVENYQEVA